MVGMREYALKLSLLLMNAVRNVPDPRSFYLKPGPEGPAKILQK